MVVILAYHEVGRASPGSFPVKAEVFTRQAEYLHRHGYTSMTIGRLAELIRQGNRLPSKTVVLTFDDGTVDHFTVVLPILRVYGLVGTFYLTAGYLGTTRWAEHTGPKRREWYENPPQHFSNDYPGTNKYRCFDFMDWSQAKEMHKAGMEIGAHTLQHPYLTGVPLQDAECEIRVSKEVLEQRLGVKVVSFCYPYGDHNADVIELVRKAGYTNASVTYQNDGRRVYSGNMYALARQSIGPATTLARYGLIVSGWDCRIRAMPGSDKLLSIKRWLTQLRDGRTGKESHREKRCGAENEG